MATIFPFSQAIADEICRRLICGEYLKDICNEDGMPSVGNVYYWRHTNDIFRAQYEGARQAQAEAIFDEILDIADDKSDDWIQTKFGPKFNKEAAARSRIRIHARENMIGRLNPKRFGEKSQLDITSSDGSMSPATMSDEAKAARIKAIYDAAKQRKDEAAKIKPVDDGSDLV